MKITITFEGYGYYNVQAEALPASGLGENVPKAIESFNRSINNTAEELERIGCRRLRKLREYTIKNDLSNSNMNFELDSKSWEDLKACWDMTADEKKEWIQQNRNVTIIESEPLLEPEVESKPKNKRKSKFDSEPETKQFLQEMFAGEIQVEKRLHGNILKKDLENADPNSPFYNKKVVFTGVLETLSREWAAEKAKSLGADIDTAISSKTDIVVVGTNAGPAKMKRVAELNEKRANIRVIDEAEFTDMVRVN